MDPADPDWNGLEAGAADNNQECGKLIKRIGNKNDLAILTSDIPCCQVPLQTGLILSVL